VVFDDRAVRDLSSFENPHQYSTGFRFVLVNGLLVMENGKHTGARSGRPLYGNGRTSNE
jgi:N-acyl-D-amino-acid deacylase